MGEFEAEPEVPEKRRVIHYHAGADEEAAIPSSSVTISDKPSSVEGPKLARSNTNASNASSTRSGGIERCRSIDPALAVPIEYRTLSIRIGESQERQAHESARIRSKTAAELSDVQWHTLAHEEIYKRFNTSTTDGLAGADAAQRLKEYGRNVFARPPTQWFRKIFGYFFGGFGPILCIGGILVMLSWQPLGEPNPAVANLALGIVLFAVFGIQAFFNAWQDFSSSRVMASIATMLPEDCTVIRDGAPITLRAAQIVPGDVLLAKAGNKLPADVRFVDVSSDARFDRSILTGESMPISGTIDSTDDNYLETRCIGMQGTYCISGSAIGIVVATGDQTVFGKIAKLASAPNNARTALQKEILRFVIIIVSLMLFFIVVVVVIWASYLRVQYPGYINVPTLIVSLVSVGIAFVPEGLPIALTMSLTIVAKIMKEHKVLCKSLKTVETLGAVSVICSDKTGTLTMNKMKATDCTVAGMRMTLKAAKEDAAKVNGTDSTIGQLAALAALCNAGEFDAATIQQPLEKRTIHGDATDQAILRFAEELGSVSEVRRLWRKRFELAFNSRNKFMIRVFSLADRRGLGFTVDTNEASTFNGADMLLTIKGAPDVLLDRCTTMLGENGQTRSMTTERKFEINVIKDSWSAHGKRVILLARKVLSRDIRASPNDGAFENVVTEEARSGLTLVGLIGIVDPPRPEIPEVVRTLRGAGIRIFMVTGDFKLTAQAIAVECGIVTNPPALIDDVSALKRDIQPDSSATREKKYGSAETGEGVHRTIVISGPELIKLNDRQWAQLCAYDEVVFARTTPEQKLRIVNEFQAHDNLVGMTGDGVNDAPSLKAADIGIALGSGSDIAIEAADMVLLDSFAGIVAGVLYGRVVFDNLKKTIAYLLPAGSYSEFWPVLTNIIFGLPQVLSSFLMIIICCFTDCGAAITLALEKPEADVMQRPPRDPKRDRLVDWRLLLQSYLFIGTLETLTSFSVAYWFVQRSGLPFSTLWFGYGSYGDLDPAFVAATLNQASSVYFVNLVVMQWFNLMALRTRRLSIFQHPPVFNKRTQNVYLFPAIMFSLGMVFLFCYVPGLQAAVGTTPVPVEHFFLPVAFGLAILGLDEGRKYCVRRWPKGVLARVAW